MVDSMAARMVDLRVGSTAVMKVDLKAETTSSVVNEILKEDTT